MKYCKKCGVLFSSVLERCPKCNPALEEGLRAEEATAPEAPAKTRRRQWLGIVLGIPALILFLYIVISRLYAIT